MKYLDKIEDIFTSWLMCENYNGNYVKLFVIIFRVLLFVIAVPLLVVSAVAILSFIINS